MAGSTDLTDQADSQATAAGHDGQGHSGNVTQQAAPAAHGAPRQAPPDPEEDGNPPQSNKRDILAETGPLIAVLVAILVVVGLAALAAVKTSYALLGVAIAGQVVATYLVVVKVLSMTSEQADRREEGSRQVSGHHGHA